MSHLDPSGEWRVAVVTTAAGDLHSLDLSEVCGGERHVVVCVPTRPALVLGSTQPDDGIDARAASAAGVEVVRRRSGGGAVWVHPDDSVWIDLWVPRGDPLWTDDVSASMLFAGDAFVAAIGGAPGLQVWRERFVAGQHGRTVCFASMAPGEVVGPSGKVVGMSQRRDRHGARVQCIAYRRWHPTDWSRLFVDDEIRRAADALPVTCIDCDADVMSDRLVSVLPRA